MRNALFSKELWKSTLVTTSTCSFEDAPARSTPCYAIYQATDMSVGRNKPCRIVGALGTWNRNRRCAPRSLTAEHSALLWPEPVVIWPPRFVSQGGGG